MSVVVIPSTCRKRKLECLGVRNRDACFLRAVVSPEQNAFLCKRQIVGNFVCRSCRKSGICSCRVEGLTFVCIPRSLPLGILHYNSIIEFVTIPNRNKHADNQFIGTEYSDGTIRNKIIVGHKRSAIYLANLITAGAVSLLLCGISFLTTLCFGLPLLGGFTNDLKVILAIALCTLLLSLALASIFTLIALLCQNKAFTAILCVVFAFIVLLVGGYVIQRLQEPETYDAYVTTMGEEGAGASSTVQKDIPNPNYLRGTQRQIYQFLADFLPGGQAIQCNSCIVSNPPLLYAYSILIILGTTGAGLLLFARKDLK